MTQTYRLTWDADQAGNAGSLRVFSRECAEKTAAGLRHKYGYRGVKVEVIEVRFSAVEGKTVESVKVVGHLSA